MPTSYRLVSALLYAALAWVVSDLVMDVITAETQRQSFGSFQLVNAAIGILVGWIVVGKRLGSDYVTAIGIGFTGMLTLVFWCLFAHSFAEMLRLSLARRYDGPVEAIVSIFKLGIDYAGYLAHGSILGVLLVGGMLQG